MASAPVPTRTSVCEKATPGFEGDVGFDEPHAANARLIDNRRAPGTRNARIMKQHLRRWQAGSFFHGSGALGSGLWAAKGLKPRPYDSTIESATGVETPKAQAEGPGQKPKA
jgi:hypothetical protein